MINLRNSLQHLQSHPLSHDESLAKESRTERGGKRPTCPRCHEMIDGRLKEVIGKGLVELNQSWQVVHNKSFLTEEARCQDGESEGGKKVDELTKKMAFSSSDCMRT